MRRPAPLHTRLLVSAVLGSLVACRCSEPPPVAELPPTPAPIVREGLLENPQHLSNAFSRLQKLEDATQDRFAVLQFGASHTAALTFAEQLHRRLGEKFGDRGPGYIPFAPMKPAFAQALPEYASERGRVQIERGEGWESETALYAKPGRIWSLAGSRLWGKSGGSLTVDFCPGCTPDGGTAEVSELPQVPLTTPAGDLSLVMAVSDGGTTLALSEAPDGGVPTLPPVYGRLDIAMLAAPNMPRVEMSVGETRRRFPGARVPNRSLRVESFEIEGPPGALNISISGPGRVALFGVAYEREERGVVYDSLGLSGSSTYVTDRYDKTQLAAQIEARRPDLLVLFYGTNESVMKNVTADGYRKRYLSVLKALRSTPSAPDCLLISNTDRDTKAPDGGWIGAQNADLVEETIQQVAVEAGCAFWSARRAMGGAGSVRDWLERTPPFALPDRTHLTEDGYRVLADALADDLLHSYGAWKASEGRRVPAPNR